MALSDPAATDFPGRLANPIHASAAETVEGLEALLVWYETQMSEREFLTPERLVTWHLLRNAFYHLRDAPTSAA